MVEEKKHMWKGKGRKGEREEEEQRESISNQQQSRDEGLRLRALDHVRDHGPEMQNGGNLLESLHEVQKVGTPKHVAHPSPQASHMPVEVLRM